MVSKQEIFDLFYKIQPTTRSGGGTSKNKMARCAVSKQDQDTMLSKIKDEAKLLAYYNKLLTRDVTIAPPPRPD